MDIINDLEFKMRVYSREQLIDIANHNNGICIETMDYTISYMLDIDRFKITYTNPDLKDCIVDYYYLIDHFR